MDNARDNQPRLPEKGLACICGKTDTKPCQSTGIQLEQLIGLYNQIADVMHEHGCWCLAEKFKALAANWAEQDGCSSDNIDFVHGSKPQCYIFPLTTALSTTEYYDHALSCAQVASQVETTRELVYLRAFLYLVLGDTDEACRLYQHAAQKWGNISPAELEQIRGLVHQHICEDDISEIYEELARSCTQ